MASATGAAGPQVQRGVLIQQGGLSPRVQTFLCCNGEGGEDPHFFVLPASAMEEAVEKGAVECPALWVDAGALQSGRSVLHVVYRLGGGPVVSPLPLKPLKLQPAKSGGGGGSEGGSVAYRAYVSSGAYTQAYRIHAGLLPKLGSLHDHLEHSGIPIDGQLGGEPCSELYSCDGLRALALQDGLLLERCDPATGQLSRSRIAVNLQNACLELHEAGGTAVSSSSSGSPTKGAGVTKCMRTINMLAEAVVALEGRPGAAVSASPLKPGLRGGSAAASPAKPPLPSGLDSVRHGIALVQSCAAAQLREGVALLSAAAGAPQLAASAVIMGALEALASAAASVQPSPVMGLTELHMLLSQALAGLLDAAPASAHAAARAVSVLGAVLAKNCANPLLLCRVLASLLQRPNVRLEAQHHGLATTISAAYTRLAPGLETTAQLLLASLSEALGPEAAGSPSPGGSPKPAWLKQQEQGQEQQPAVAAAAEVRSSGPTAAVAAAAGARSPSPAGPAALPAAFGSPQVVLIEPAPAPAAAKRPAKHGSLLGKPSVVAKPLAPLPAVRTKPAPPPPPAAAHGSEGYVAHVVATFNAMKVDSEQPASPSAAGGRSRSPAGRGAGCGSGGVLTMQDSNAGSPYKASSPARSASALSTASLSLVPRLLLPGCESPTAAAASAGGLTRSTRRALSSSPAGRRSPSPTRFGSPVRNSEEAAEQTAMAELAALGGVLGEALVAADLPSIVAHKRRAAGGFSSADDEALPELLQPPTPGVRKALEAHKIFTTAKSLRSLESTPTNTTDTAMAGGGGGGATARAAAEAEAIKCLLLEALLASLPVVGAQGYPDRDPSPTLAMEVLSLLGQPLSQQQEQLVALCLRALQQLSSPAAPPASECPPHVLLALAACKLSHLVPQLGAAGPAWATAEAVGLLQLMAEYVKAAPGANVAAAGMCHCSGVLQSLAGVLLAAGLEPSEWAVGSWRLFHRLVALLAALASKCHDAEAGRSLLRVAVADQQTAAMLSAAASLALLYPEVVASPGFAYRAGSAMLQREALQLLIELAALVGRQPAALAATAAQQEAAAESRAMSRLSSISSVVWEDQDAAGAQQQQQQQSSGADLLLAPGPKGGRRLTRGQAFQLLWPFLSSQSGFVRRILDHDPRRQGGAGAAVPPTPLTPAPSDSVRLRHDVLQLLRTAFSAPGNPFVQDKATTDFYIQFHFIQFLKLYHNPQRDHQALNLCKKHMEVLLALAGHKTPHSRKRFQQLSVMDFFVREVSLEFECSEPAAARHRRSRSNSTEPRRRSSSFSLDGDTTRRLSDRSGSGREAPLLPLALPPGQPEPPPAATPPTVPALRLGFSKAAAESTFSLQQAQQSQQQQAGGAGSGSRPSLGLAIPRLNLPGTPPLGSPVEGLSPSGLSSARLGRPPLPPSARTARMGTPRTSRLGRPAGEGFNPSPSIPGATAAEPCSAKPGKSTFAIHIHASATEGGLPGPAEGSQPGAAPGRPLVPRLLGLGRPGLPLGKVLPLASPGGSDGGASSVGPQQGASPRPPHSRAASSVMDSDPGSDDEEGDCGGAGLSSRAASPRAQQQQQQQQQPALGLRVPAGFVWSGDLDEDVARLEAMEGLCEEEEEEEAASPTIPAHRHAHFDLPTSTPPATLLGMVPRLALPLKSPPPPVAAPSAAGAAAAGEAGDASPGDGGSRPRAIPRLNLTPSMHSNLESRTASAELQVALDTECAKRRVGRTFLGDFEKSTLGKGKMQAVSLRSRHFLSDRDALGALSLEVSYGDERARRLLYKDEALHLQALQLIFSLLLTADGALDPAYTDQLPWQRRMLNIPHILHHHLNHAETRPLLARLLPLLHSQLGGGGGSGGGGGAAAARLLRVLCGAFFRPGWYSGGRAWIGKGAYAQVYRYQLPEWAGEGTVVLKVLDLPRHFEDHCRQVDFFSEVSIMEALAPSPAAATLLDFGIHPAADAMLLVMHDYRCSLRRWREAQPADPRGQLRLYLQIFQQVLAAVKSLMEANVLHFDLKCDNVLLEPLPCTAEADFWAPPVAAPPFRLVLADFGESKLFTGSLDAAMTVRNRGTECAKSPEMLLAANAAKKDARTYDRRRREGAGAASDVWSLGCLLYELVTGQFLFSVEPDWVRFFVHITDPRSGPLLPPDRLAAVQHLPGVLGLLQFILVRDARLRPTLHDVQARVEALLHGSRTRLPPHVPPPARADAPQHGSGRLFPAGSHPLPSPSLLSSPQPAPPLPLAAPLPIAPGLLLAPLATAQSAQALRQQGPLRRVVLLVGPLTAAPPESQPSTARSSLRAGRALVPIGNTLGGGASAAGSPPRAAQQPDPAAAAGASAAPPSSYSDPSSSPASSPFKSLGGRHSRGSSFASSFAQQLGKQQQQQQGAGPHNSSPSRNSGGGSTASPSRLGTPRSLFAESSALAARAEGSRRPARPLFNSARVHAASATNVPAVFEAARGPELGGCSEWPGSSSSGNGGGAQGARQQAGGQEQAPPRPPSRLCSNGTLPASPRRPHSPLLPAGFGGGDSSTGGRSAAVDAAALQVLSTPELAQCGAACAAAGLPCQLLPSPGPAGGAGAGAGSTLKPPLPLHRWVALALAALEAGEAGQQGAQRQGAAQRPLPPVLLAVQPGCEPEAAALSVAFLMAHRRQGLYQAMVHAARWGVDLHLGPAHLADLQQWAGEAAALAPQ